ncbi:hypothetical protein [Serratia marcescens]|uniref:MrpH family fimbial adhesin n=1 Tax=Serratia marcescens TaxID=615 RepID=UPI000F7F5090|nr:hypothetical protein [Serratia marcescens]UTL85636.1 hypothetical protein NLX77_22435 [Serratia marcescens]UYY67232.1 hypothetical protein OKB57_22485 [Serratia marcescens]
MFFISTTRSFKLAALIVVGAVGLYSPLSFSYVQQSTRLPAASLNMNSVGHTELTPGSGAVRVATFRAGVAGQYPNESVTCISGCSDGQTYLVDLSERWSQAGGILLLNSNSTVTGVKTGGGSATFNVTTNGSAFGGLARLVDSRSNSMNFTDGIAYHTNPWIGSFNVPTNPPYVWHNASYDDYSFDLRISAPVGTPAGTYTINATNNFYFALLYCSSSCSFSQATPRAAFGVTGAVSVTVLGKCAFSNASMMLDYSSLSPKAANRSEKKSTTQLTCNSDVSSGTLKLVSTSGSNQTSTTGTSVKVGDNMDAIVTVNGKDASSGIALQGPFNIPIEVASTLNTYGNIPKPGAFQGSAVLSFEPD